MPINPKIQMIENGFSHVYLSLIRTLLMRLCNNEFLNEPLIGEKREEALRSFEATLPLVACVRGEGNLFSFFLICRQRPEVGKFFFDVINRWQRTAQNVQSTLSFSADFTLPDLDEETYTLCEVDLKVDAGEVERLYEELPLIESEIRLGVGSIFHAMRIRELTGLSSDEKSALVQQRIAKLVQSRPADFDYDIFSQMQHFLLTCREDFKAAREYELITRIICVFYLFRSILRDHMQAFPEKRHLTLRVCRVRLNLPLGLKEVLGIFVGMNFLKEHEVFEEKHLIKAIQTHLPEAHYVEDSFFSEESKEEKIRTIYLEVEKAANERFTVEDMQKLRRGLVEDVKSSVEQLMLPLFMPRNEEEVMRNIITLSQQLKFVRDLPQVIISFNEQKGSTLSFTVILVRILQPDSSSIEMLFQGSKRDLLFLPDRVKRMGTIRNKYPKEATVFRVHLSNQNFLREDYSVDLYRARQQVVFELQEAIGEFRDFNGGMIAKQIEAFALLKEGLGQIGETHQFFLENFFHSLFPVEARSVTPIGPLRTLFLMLLSLTELKQEHYLEKEEEGTLFLLTILNEPASKLKALQEIADLELRSSQLVCLDLKMGENNFLGYICFFEDLQKRTEIKKILCSGSGVYAL